MNPTQLAGLVKRVYPNFDMTKFSDRLKLQKSVYLIQSVGLNLGYNFSLYLRGPYCTQLARDGFDMPKFNDIEQLKFEDNKQEETFNKLLIFLNDKKDDAKIMEILGSVHIFHRLFQDLNDEKIILKVREKNQEFKEEQIRPVLNELKKFGEIKW